MVSAPVILGAGPAGLAVAWRLAQAGLSPLVLEKASVVGGLGQTFEDEGYRFDLGPHILHPKHKEIADFMQRIVGPEMTEFSNRAQILFRGKLVNYPLRGLQSLTSLPSLWIIPAGLNFLWARAELFVKGLYDEKSFQEWITNRFGRILYSIYFGPYAEKVWKLPGDQLDAHIARSRVPAVSIRALIRQALKLAPQTEHAEDGHLKKYYCRFGVGQLAMALYREMIQFGGTLYTGCDVQAIELQGHQVKSVTYRREGQTHTSPADQVISSIPLPELVALLGPAAPEPVRKAAQGLDYCAERLVYLKIGRPEVKLPSLLYFSDPRVRFNRVYNIGSFSRDCVPPGRSALCVEYTCEIGDEVWNREETLLAQEVTQVFEKYGFLQPGDITGVVSRRLTHAYPRFRVGFKERLNTVLTYLGTIQNLRTLGRQGLFNYANIDDVMHMGFEMCDEILNVPARKVTP
jgi:protoporphyrinogen oxidase